MRVSSWCTVGLAAALLAGCEADLTDEEIIAAKADQTTRQLIAGLNAENQGVMKRLLVITSAEGGEPRPLTDEELDRVVYPPPKYAYAGAGEPGTMRLRAGDGKKRQLRLIVLDGELKVLATREKLSAYTARESGEDGRLAPGDVDVRVISFLSPVQEASK